MLEGRNCLRVLIICNKGSKTGGPKALHELAQTLKDQGIEVSLCDPYPFERFRKPVADYAIHNPTWLRGKKIPGEIELLVAPESFSRLPRSFLRRSKKSAVWWLSIDNAEFEFVKPYLERRQYGSPQVHWRRAASWIAVVKRSLRKALLRAYRKVFWKKVDPKSSIHFFQSAYARDVVEKSLGVSGYNLSDISEIHGAGIDLRHLQRSSNLIVYNGNKGSGYVTQLARRLSDFEFLMLKGLDSVALAKALSRASFYLDLGHFPGKDRMPREAIRLGCPVILAKRGSARYVEDFDIPEEFLLDLHNNSPEEVASHLRRLLGQKDEALRNQDKFRRKVLIEDEVFKGEVKTVVTQILGGVNEE